jgi:hypothetical protein
MHPYIRATEGPITALLLVSHQICSEALHILYQQNTFLVILDTTFPKFEVELDPLDVSGQRFITQNPLAMPYTLDLSNIVHLRIGVEIWVNDSFIGTRRLMETIQWTAFSLMKSLQTPLLFIVTRFTGPSNSPPVYNAHIDGNGKAPNGSIWYRQMMRNLIALLPKQVLSAMGRRDTTSRSNFTTRTIQRMQRLALYRPNSWKTRSRSSRR